MSSSSNEILPRVGLIGVTGYGKTHLDIVLRNHRAGVWKFTSVTIINPTEAAEQIALFKDLGVKIFADYREMLQQGERLDLVCIPTAIHWHTPMTLDALRAGANVFVEKPLAGSVEEVESIIQARDDTGHFVAVGFQHLYCPRTWQIKEWLLAGRIGRVHRLKGVASWPRNLNYYNRNGWAGKLTVNGHAVYDSPLNNALAHQVNLLLFLGGSSRANSAQITLEEAALFRAQPIENFDTASVHGHTSEGAEFFFHATHSSETEQSPLLRIEGELGCIELTSQHGVRLETEAGKFEQLIPPPTPGESNELIAAALAALLAGDTPDYCSVEIAREHAKFIAALHQLTEPKQVPDSSRELTESDQWIIPGLLPKLQHAFATNTLLRL